MSKLAVILVLMAISSCARLAKEQSDPQIKKEEKQLLKDVVPIVETAIESTL